MEFSEIIHVQLLEPCLCRRRQGSPGAFELRPETLNGLVMSSQFLSFVLALKLMHAEIHNPDVEVLALLIACHLWSCLHFKDATLNRQERNVKGAAAHILDQYV